MTLYKWSKTAASNATADATINWAEGQAPSSVNDSARALMAAVAKHRDDVEGSLNTGGSATAYTLTTNQVFDSLANMDSKEINFFVHTTSGASPTLNVDGLGAKSIFISNGVPVPTGALISGVPYRATYINAAAGFIMQNNFATPNSGFASGTRLVFQQTAAPTGWTKDTTHNDKALRVVSGTASSGGTTAFTTVFAARTIAQANLPNVTLTTNITDPGHTHTVVTFANPPPGAGVSGGTGASAGNAVGGAANNTTGITASTPLGGSGTAMDFAVQYIDVIFAQKD